MAPVRNGLCIPRITSEVRNSSVTGVANSPKTELNFVGRLRSVNYMWGAEVVRQSSLNASRAGSSRLIIIERDGKSLLMRRGARNGDAIRRLPEWR